MAKDKNMFILSSRAKYDEIVAVFSAMVAHLLVDALLTDEKQSQFIDALMQYQGIGEEDK